MKNLYESPVVNDQARVIQIICGALIVGVLVFFTIVYFVADKQKMGMTFDVMTIVMAAMAAMTYFASFIVPAVMRSNMKSLVANSKSDEQAVKSALGVCQTTEIVRAALLEGGAIANIIAFLLDSSLLSLIVVGVGIGLMIGFFPTRGRIIDKVENLTELK